MVVQSIAIYELNPEATSSPGDLYVGHSSTLVMPSARLNTFTSRSLCRDRHVSHVVLVLRHARERQAAGRHDLSLGFFLQACCSPFWHHVGSQHIYADLQP